MSSLISHTVAYLIRLMCVPKLLYFIAWLWPSYESTSAVSDPVIHLSDPTIAREVGAIMQLNRSIEYEKSYSSNKCIREEVLIIAGV